MWIEGVSASKEENMSLAKDNTMVSVGKVGAAVGLKGETKGASLCGGIRKSL